MKYIVLFLIFLTSFFIIHSCTCKENKNLDFKNISKIIVDKTTRTKFILDTDSIYITAINEKNETLWRTDPWKDNKLQPYRYARPIIEWFDFNNDKWSNFQEVIGITYNSSQFGFLDKKTGKFTWEGQD